jgi:hypothetical protein
MSWLRPPDKGLRFTDEKPASANIERSSEVPGR